MIEKIDRYEIHKEIGRGAMGIVYMGYDPNIGRTVAVKTLRMDLFSDAEEKDEFLIRFKREAQTAGRLSHPNIVTIYDLGQDNISNNLYIIMEFISGKNLKEIIGKTDIINPETSLTILSQIADGLDFAHKNGIIHRDIKPANILLTSSKVVKITDFGIAKISGTNYTQTGKSLGTPSYMSPEQVLGKDITYKSDLFSFGALAYEILTGEKAFKGNNITSIVYKILNEKPVLPESNIFSKNEGLVRAIMKCMDRDPAKRYMSASEFIADIKTAMLSAPGEAEPETQAVYMKDSGSRKDEEYSTGSHTSRTEIDAENVPASVETIPEAQTQSVHSQDSTGSGTMRIQEKTGTALPGPKPESGIKKGRSKLFWAAIALLLLANIALFSTVVYFLYTGTGIFKRDLHEKEITADLSEESEDLGDSLAGDDVISIIDEEYPMEDESLQTADEEEITAVQDPAPQAVDDTIPADSGVPEKDLIIPSEDTASIIPVGTQHAENIHASSDPDIKEPLSDPEIPSKPDPYPMTESNSSFNHLKRNIRLYDTVKKNDDTFRRPRGFTLVGNSLYITEDPLGRGDPVIITDIASPSSFKVFNSERLDTPSDIKANKRGVIDVFIVSDTNNSTIKFFDKMGNLLNYIDNAHKKPFFIVNSPGEESFFITDYDTGHVYKYTTRGELQSKSRSRLEKPMGIAYSQGILYVVDNGSGKIHKFRQNLSEAGSFKLPSDITDNPVGIAVYRDILLVADMDKGYLIAMTPGGEFAGTVSPPDIKSPYYMEIIGNRLFISDNSNGYIYIYEY